MTNIYVPYVVNGENLTVKVDIISINTVSNSQCRQLNVVVTDGALNIILRDAHCSHNTNIGNTSYLRCGCTAAIDHSRRRELFNAFYHHVAGKFTQTCKSVISITSLFLILEGYVQIKGRDVRRTGFHHFRTVHLLWHSRHGHIYLFVDINKKKIDITTR